MQVPIGKVQPGRWAWIIRVSICALMAALAFAGFVWNPRASTSKPQSIATLPSSVYDLVEKASEGTWHDIAVTNLLCAKGLPDAVHLDVGASLALLDSWVDRVRFETQRHIYRFKRDPAEYENSWGYYCMIMLVTVLQQDLGVRYNMEAVGNWDFSHSSDVFINGLLSEKRTGTCASMPVLYVAVGRRLGYPLHLVPARGHLFARWEDTRLGGGGERFNIEATGRGIVCKSDEYYKTWPMPISEAEIRKGNYLRSLTPREELAEFLNMRGNCLEDIKRTPEAVAMYGLAHSLDSSSPRHRVFIAFALGLVSDGPLLSARPMSMPRRHPPPVDEHERQNQWVSAMNEHNRQMLAGEIPVHTPLPAFPPSTP